MRPWLLPIALFAAVPLFAADRTPAPLPAEKAAAGMVLPDGFRATVFAAEPDVVQPIGFCTDDRGRLWVAEAFNYGSWKPTGKDRVTILEDTDGDGRADKRTVFYEGFNYITGIEVGFGGVWVMSPPCLYFVPDRDGDDKPDGPPEVVFDGFGYKESRHNLANGFTWGPDGWLYGGHGRTCPSDVGKPGTPAEKRVHCDGGVYRVHPTRRVFENFADGTTNPWGVDFDDYGQCFVSNCVNPHLFHVIPGGHYEPWRNRPASRYAYDRLPTIADHLHYPGGGDLRKVIGQPDTLALGGGHAHCGTLVYLEDSFPAAYRNTVFMCNVHGRRVNNDVLTRKGSGYTASHGKDFMLSPDPWFMGVTLRTGPDGSVFVSDWSDTGECHTANPDTKTGRIYKISYGEPKKAAVDLAKLTDLERAKLQLSRSEWHIRHARRLLQERAAVPGWDGKAVRDALWFNVTDRSNTARRLRSLWALHVTGGLTPDQLAWLFPDESSSIPAWTVRLTCEGSPSADTLAKFAALAKSDSSPVVRLELAAALQRLPLADRWAVADGLVRHAEDASDANLPLMIWYGIEPLIPADPAGALDLAAACEIPTVRRFIARRVVDDATEKKRDLAPLVAAIGEANGPRLADLLAGARDGVQGRKSLPMPGGWKELYPTLAASDDPAVRRPAVVLAGVFGDPRALADLRKTATNPAALAADRVAAVEALAEKRGPDLAPFLHKLLADPATRAAALRGLAAVPHPDTATKVLAVYPTLPAEEKSDAIATLAARADSALALLSAVEAKGVPRSDVTAYTARQLNALGDPAVSKKLRDVWGEVRDTNPMKKEQLAKYRALVTPAALKAADPSNGRRVFQKTCQQCHVLFGVGGTIGPDLTGSNRTDPEYLLSNIIDPSAEVAKDYRMSVVKTADGRVVTGIIAERTPNRLVVQTDKDRVTISPEDVDAVTDSPLSIMPEGQLDALSKEQVRDLIAYLAGKAQVPLPPGGTP